LEKRTNLRIEDAAVEPAQKVRQHGRRTVAQLGQDGKALGDGGQKPALQLVVQLPHNGVTEAGLKEAVVVQRQAQSFLHGIHSIEMREVLRLEIQNKRSSVIGAASVKPVDRKSIHQCLGLRRFSSSLTTDSSFVFHTICTWRGSASKPCTVHMLRRIWCLCVCVKYRMRLIVQQTSRRYFSQLKTLSSTRVLSHQRRDSIFTRTPPSTAKVAWLSGASPRSGPKA